MHHNTKLQNHYNKYGREDLVLSILTVCSKEELIGKEQYYIDLFQPWFNICKTAVSCLVVKRSEETRREAGLGFIK